jgi:hypothetical protein
MEKVPCDGVRDHVRLQEAQARQGEVDRARAADGVRPTVFMASEYETFEGGRKERYVQAGILVLGDATDDQAKQELEPAEQGSQGPGFHPDRVAVEADALQVPQESDGWGCQQQQATLRLADVERVSGLESMGHHEPPHGIPRPPVHGAHGGVHLNVAAAIHMSRYQPENISVEKVHSFALCLLSFIAFKLCREKSSEKIDCALTCNTIIASTTDLFSMLSQTSALKLMILCMTLSAT